MKVWMMSASLRVRFPPSPTGRLHIGNVRTALYNWLLARRLGGAFVLRIEDTDMRRSSPESEQAILDDLRWLGLDWDEGPDRGGPNGPYRQSERLDIYGEQTRKLLGEEKAYHCFCEPEDLRAERKRALKEGHPPRYSGTCRSIPPGEARERVDGGEAAAIRFRVEPGPTVAWDDLVHGPLTFERESIGDFVTVRSGGTPAYNYAVVIDDALMRISHVIRGDDHISNTPRQILLYRALGFTPPAFGHLPMILGPDGSRLSKRHGATSVEEFRAGGYLPEALNNYLALLGWNPGDEREFFTTEELIEAFSLERVNKSAAIFSIEKLNWLNGKHLRNLSSETLIERSERFLQKRMYDPDLFRGKLASWSGEVLKTLASSSATLDDLADQADIFFKSTLLSEGMTDAERKLTDEDKKVIDVFYAASERLKPINDKVLSRILKDVSKKTGARGRSLYHPLRVAFTTRDEGTELVKVVRLLESGNELNPEKIDGVREKIENYKKRSKGK